MTPAGEVLRDEIARDGPDPFHRFMEIALYHPRARLLPPATRDPFGKHGDFYTAEQIQPVFGILIAALIRQLYREMGEPRDFTVVELGAGRGEMAEAFSEWRYVPVDVGAGICRIASRAWCSRTNSSTRCRCTSAIWRRRRVPRSSWSAGAERRFVWETGEPVTARSGDYLRRYFPAAEEGRSYEVNLDALAWMERIGRSLDSGYVLTIDYGYTRAESSASPRGR